MSFDESSDFQKLVKALSTLTGLFSSFDNILEAFGLSHMPPAQRYGIMFGVVVFFGTLSAVIMLLMLGGSFKRLSEQSRLQEVKSPDAITMRSGRPLLYEHYLEARDRMQKENYPKPQRSEAETKLTGMVLNLPVNVGNVAELVDECTSINNDKTTASDRYIPPGYEEDFKEGCRKCQEKPFGSIMSGRPEARFEAYARAFAGTGRFVTRDYRRSYSRVYEVVTCANHDSDDKFRTLYTERPRDLVGRLGRLEPLEVDRHLQKLFDFTCGDAYLENKPFDPNEIWGFFNYGPFRSPKELRESPIFQHLPNEAAFALVDNVTGRFIGIVVLTNDDPQNLTVEMQPQIIMPSCRESPEPIEACFLLMDKLFALGYRRIQLSVDTQDVLSKRFAARLGFTKEAVIPKHMVVKDANRDSIIYGMLNSDWNKGARAFLYKKLHGDRMFRRDQMNNRKEGEMEDQTQKLAEMKALTKKYLEQKEQEEQNPSG